MKTPTVAFVLGAGIGTRLRPMTLHTPKPLMPIWNRPLLAHTLDTLEQWGVKTVYINTHWLPEAMHAFIANYKGSLELHELHEPVILGTGGALRNLKPYLNEEPFWLINGDIIFDLTPENILDAFERSGNFAATWVDPKRGPRTVEMDYAGRLTDFHSPTPQVEHTYTFCGVSLLSPSILNYLPQDKAFCSVIEAFEAAMQDNHFVQGAVSAKETYWNDAGTLDRFIQAHRDIQKTVALKRYLAEASVKPETAVNAALKLLGWSATETIRIPMGIRGSQRTFWRLISPRRSVIAIAYETKGREENAKYAMAARLLAKAGVAVPAVIAEDAKKRLLILEDLGDQTLDKVPLFSEKDALQNYLDSLHTTHSEHEEHEEETCSCGCGHHHSIEATTLSTYPLIAKTMQLLARFHIAAVDMPLEAPFDADLYNWEQSLYTQFAGSFPADCNAELQTIKETLLAEPLVLVHRDFQSSNILIHKEAPYVIDFQGMRVGPAVYDLASFLYDPYVTWPEDVITEALHAYAAAKGLSEKHLQKILPFAGVQRLIQAIGAYHRLASVGQPRFLAYVPIAQKRAAELAQTAGLVHLAQHFNHA